MKPFKRLRIALVERDLNISSLAPVLGVKNASNVSSRFLGNTDWSLSEMYAVLDFLGIPESDMHLYFPRGGKDVFSKEVHQ